MLNVVNGLQGDCDPTQLQFSKTGRYTAPPSTLYTLPVYSWINKSEPFTSHQNGYCTKSSPTFSILPNLKLSQPAIPIFSHVTVATIVYLILVSSHNPLISAEVSLDCNVFASSIDETIGCQCAVREIW